MESFDGKIHYFNGYPSSRLTIIDAAVVSGCYSLHPDMLDKALVGYALATP